MSLLVLTRYPTEYEPLRLKEEAGKAGLETDIVSYKRIIIDHKKVSVPLDSSSPSKYQILDTRYSYIVPRSATSPSSSLVKTKTAILKSLAPGQICLNKESFLTYPLTGKIMQSEFFAKAGLPTVPSRILDKEDDWKELLKSATYPLIVKGAFGSHGREVFAAKSFEEARHIIYSQRWTRFITQPLVTTPYWIRTIVLGDQCLGYCIRKTKDRFLPERIDNSLGGKGIPPLRWTQLAKISLKAAKLLKADFTGNDFLYYEGKWQLLEVNRTPQFKIFEKKTGVNVAGKIIEYLKRNSI